MDMQMTIFSDTDFATAQNAFFDANAFKAFIQRYDPSFISVSLNRSYFKKIIATDERFVPIFFDHVEMLYVNKSHHRDLAERYVLKAVDPFRFREINYENLGEDVLAPMFAEAAKMRDEDPANYSANHILGMISIVRKQYDQAIFHAEVILRNYPDLSHGYALKGDALRNMDRYEEAASLYKKALEMGQTSRQENVYWNLHAVYVKLKEYKKAYKVLSKYVNPFNPNTDYKEIYQLGMSAATVGKIREAVTFLKIAKLKVPSTDAEYVEKIDKNLAITDNTPDVSDGLKEH
ncbi:MAG: tetratricopeptide repeat protein [Syntrophales bacterium]